MHRSRIFRYNVSNTKRNKIIILCRYYSLIKQELPHLHNGTIREQKLMDKNYLRLYTRLKSNDKFDNEISLLERVPGTQNWFRRVTT
ncbi:hypothetical protein [Mycoplasmopsis cynos]|uniref:hypothetical protein n=1 Tax=Mycoplasmopsis cynos TaxID=171284 RepID=UPI0025423BC4|nr:hypothetical protein [Mycoplasmopsis cynos]MCU9934821.1 hypothetical protein [Mycoplasmopsis cynos]